MKALITGANGFLGSAVLRLLVSEGYDVRVLVRPNADKRNLEKFDLKIQYLETRNILKIRS